MGRLEKVEQIVVGGVCMVCGTCWERRREKGGVVFGLNQLVDDYNYRVGWKLRVE